MRRWLRNHVGPGAIEFVNGVPMERYHIFLGRWHWMFRRRYRGKWLSR